MKSIEINNDELKQALDEIGEWFNTFDLENNIRIFGKEDKNEYYTGEEFFVSQIYSRYFE